MYCLCITLPMFTYRVMIAAVNISNSSLDVEFFNNFNDDEAKGHLKHSKYLLYNTYCKVIY